MPYLRNSIAYDNDFWHICVNWWYVQYIQVFFSSFFFFFFEILIVWVGSGVKRQICPKMIKNSVCCSSYLRNHTSYVYHLWYTCVKGWYLQVFLFIFPNFWFFGLLGGEKVNNGPKWEKFCLAHSISQEPYIIWFSFMVHMCKMIISPSISPFFQNFGVLEC